MAIRNLNRRLPLTSERMRAALYFMRKNRLRKNNLAGISGDFAVIENIDVFSASGGIVSFGNFAVIENIDVFSASGSLVQQFPVIAQQNFRNFNATSSITMSGAGFTISAGNLLVVHIANAGTGTPSTPSGWTQNRTIADVNNRNTLFTRVADGTATDTPTFSGWGTQDCNMIAYRVTKASGNREASNYADYGGTATWPTPIIAPSWGSKKTLFIAMSGEAFAGNAPTFPANYPLGRIDGRGGGGIDIHAFGWAGQFEAVQNAAGNFVSSSSGDQQVVTLAIEPVG